MLFQPSVIALLLAATLSLVMVAAAAPFAWQILRRWDLGSGSEVQLQLERRTYLFSTLAAFVCASQLLALLLFVFTADRLSAMFVGAMCAVGALNADAWGFPALLLQVALFFLAALWLVLNHVDTRARNYPLVRLKYALLLGLTPLLALSAWLQWSYFRGLKADIITSCCGSLFSGDGNHGVAGEMAGLAPLPAMLWFYGSLGLAALLAAWHAWSGRLGLLAGLSSGAAFVGGIGGIVSFLSLYLYEHPHHHCPFCILKPEYDYQGYALYLPLFAATAAGMGSGVLQLVRRVRGLEQIAPAASRRLATVAAWGFGLLLCLAAGMMAGSRLVLLEP